MKIISLLLGSVFGFIFLLFLEGSILLKLFSVVIILVLGVFFIDKEEFGEEK